MTREATMNAKLIFLLIASVPITAIADQDFYQCMDTLYTRPELAPLLQKIGAADVKNASFEALINQEKASDQDKPLIAILANGSKSCWDAEKAKQTPDMYQKSVNAFNANENNKITALADLYTQKISFGEYIKLRKESVEKAEMAYQEADAEIAEYNRGVDENNEKIRDNQRAQQARGLANAFGNISNSIRNSRPAPAVNCIPNYLGGFRCQ